MKSLLLVRHAKASSSQTGLADFDRPLVDEGREAAERIGKFLKRDALKVDAALSSPAVRARQTIDTVLRAAEMSLQVRTDHRLYEGGRSQLLEVLSEVDDSLNSVLLVGHNPVLEEFVQLLTAEMVSLSPGTLAQLDLEATQWSEIDATKNTLSRLVRP